MTAARHPILVASVVASVVVATIWLISQIKPSPKHKVVAHVTAEILYPPAPPPPAANRAQ